MTLSQPGASPPAPGSLTFRGGMYASFAAPLIFLAGVITYFVVFDVFDTNALTAAGLVGLLAGALLSRDYAAYWSAAMRGLTSPTAATLVMILLVVGMFSALLDVSGAAGGLIWLANELSIGGSLFAALAFTVACLMSMATGTSLGTLFAAFPVIFPAGIALGADPLLLAGAILSGALFGDNLAPISDSTIVSATTQRFRRKAGVADIAGVVRSRAKYSLTAALISLVLYLVAGAMTGGPARPGAVAEEGGPLPLVMLIAVAVLLAVAFWTRDLFLASTSGLVVGVIVGLVAGVLTPAEIISAKGDAAAGFLVTGIVDVTPLVVLAIVVFAIIGVLEASGVFDAIVGAVTGSRLAATPRGAELTIGVGAIVSGGLFAGVNGPTMMFYGPLADRVGASAGLHPYRRSNVMDCCVLGLGSIVPVVSAFLLVTSTLTADAAQVPAVAVFGTAFYPLVLTVVMFASILTGWGRIFEGPDGAAVRERPAE